MSLLQPTVEAFVTHVECTGPLLKLWAQLDRTRAKFIERLIVQLTDKFEREVSTINTIKIGHVCCARYSDGVYYRARIIGASELEEGKVSVHFIDYGNSETVSVTDIRYLDEPALSPLVQLDEQATEFFLAGVIPLAGTWDDRSLAFVKQMLCYEELRCVIVGRVSDKKILKVLYHNEDLATILIGKKIGVAISPHAQQVLIQGIYGLSSVPPEFPGFNVPPPTGLLLPPPSQPQLAMPILPPIRMVSAPQQMIVKPVIQPPVQETVKVFTSPKLEINSKHMVYVSCVEDGPFAFAVQLQATEDVLSTLMSEINTPPAIPLSQPLMPGSVCLGRFTEDQSLCRAVVLDAFDDKYKLYYVDFGISEILPYSEIYELPQKFINVKVMAVRFALSGLANLDVTDELKAYFKNLVTEKLLCLRVVAPEGPPLKHYGELYWEGTSIFQFLVQKMKEIEQSRPTDYELIPALPIGTRELVKVSYIVNLSHFYVQFVIHTEALNSVMLAVDTTCTNSSSHLDTKQLRLGLPCCALYSEDGKWYRAKILSLSSNSIEVMYIDYGNTDNVPLSSLKPIDPSLINILKPQAIPCCLNGYENNVDDGLAVRFEEITLDKSLMMVVVGSENEKLLIDLLDRTTGLHINVEDQTPQEKTEMLSYNSPPTEICDWEESNNNTEETEMSYRGKSYEKKPWGGERGRNQRDSRLEDDRFHNAGGDGNKPWHKKDTNNWRQVEEDTSNRAKWRNGAGDMEEDGQRKFRSRDEGERGGGGSSRWNSDENGGRRKRWNNNEEDRSSWKKKNESERDGGFRRKRNGNEEEGGFKKRWNDGDNGGQYNKWDNNNDDGRGFHKKWNDNEEGGGSRKNKWQDDNENYQKGKRFGDSSNKWRNNRNEDDFNSRKQKSWGDNDSTTQNYRFKKGSSSEEKDIQMWTPSSAQVTEDTWDEVGSISAAGSKILEPCVKIGDTKTVNVVYIGSPEEFCVQVSCESEKLTEIMDGIAVTYGSGGGNPLTEASLKSGTPCVARYSEDDTVYRAIIESVGENTVSVLFCDYGNKEDVSIDDIKEISSEYMKLPAQGIMCKLLAAKPQQLTWTDVEISEFLSFTEGKELQVHFVNKTNEMYEVVLEDKENGVNINEKFGAAPEDIKSFSSMTTSKIPSGFDTESITIASPEQRFITQTLAPEFRDDVVITWFVNPEKFYCQLLSSESNLSDMMNTIQSAYCGKSPVKSTLEVGMPVIAKFKSDGVLYRAEVKSLQDTSSYVVQFIDYGNHDLVDRYNLWDIEARFINLPIQAHLCSLRGVKPLNSEWTRQEEIDKLFEAESFNCTFHNNEDGVNFVTLTSSEGKSIAEELVGAGLGICSKTLQEVTDDAEPIDITLLCGQILHAYITYIEGVSKFCIQINKKIGDKIQELIAQHVQKPENMIPIGPESLSVNTPCIATPDGEQWYRGKIIDCATTTGVFVKFIDFGDGDEIPLDKMSSIPLELARYAEQCVECCLTHSKDTVIKSEDEDRFKTEFEATDVIINVDSVENERLLVTIFNTEGTKPELLKDMGAPLTEVEPILPLPIISRKSVVWISHVDGPKSLWLQRVKESEILSEILESLYSFYEIDKKGIGLEMSVGKFCAAKSTNDENWYRGKIISHDVDEGICSVLFVDYGNSEALPVSQVMTLDPSFFTPHAQAVCVSLPVICDESTDITALLLEMVAEKKFVAQFSHKKNDIWIVDLFEEEVSMCKKLLASNLVKDLEYYPFSPIDSSKIQDTEKIAVYVSHVECQCEIWIQKAENYDAIMNLQDDLQNTAESTETITSIPPVATKCIALFSGAWYRAVVLGTNDTLVTVHFIDYGNKDDIDILSEGLKSLPARLQDIPEYAEKCILDKGFKFMPGALERLEMLVLGLEEPLTLLTLKEDVTKYVDIQFSDGTSVLNLLLEEGLAKVSIQNECPETENVFVSHVNSPASFWIQYEKDADEIGEMESKMFEAESFSNVEEAAEGELHAAMFSDDQWYRAKILRKTNEGYEVLFIDYGNLSVVTELKVLPDDLLNLPPFAKHCSLPLSVNLQWSDEAKNTLIERAAGGEKSFKIQILKDGDPATVRLSDGDCSLEDELSKLSPSMTVGIDEVTSASKLSPSMTVGIDENSASKLSHSMTDGIDEIASASESNINTCEFNSESAVISHVISPSSFWIQFKNSTNKIEEVVSRLYEDENMLSFEQAVEGNIYAAMFSDGQWYRVKIINRTDKGCEVLFIDYGYTSVVVELKSLPEDLQNLPPLAKHCALPLLSNLQWCEEAKNKLIEKAADGNKSFNVRVVADGDPAIISLCDGDSTVEDELPKLKLTVNDLNDAADTVLSSCKSNACVCHVNSLSDFWVQFEDSADLLEIISNQLEESDNIPIPEKLEINTLCVAKFPEDGNWYRAKILSHNEECTEVMYIDFGNTSITTEFRQLPENLLNISPIAKNCSLLLPDNVNEWQESDQDLFVEIVGDVSKLFEVEIVSDGIPAVINLYDAGEKIQNILLSTSTKSENILNEEMSVENGIGENKKCNVTNPYMETEQNSVDQNDKKSKYSIADDTEELDFEETFENGDVTENSQQIEIEEYARSVEENDTEINEQEGKDEFVEDVKDGILETEENGRLMKGDFLEEMKKDSEWTDGSNVAKENLKDDNDIDNSDELTCSNLDMLEKLDRVVEDVTGKEVPESVSEINITECLQESDHFEKDLNSVLQYSSEEESCHEMNPKIEVCEPSTVAVNRSVEEITTQKTEHTEKLVRELNVLMKMPQKESTPKNPSNTCEEDSHLNSSHSLRSSNAKKITASVEKGHITQSAPSTPVFSRPKMVSKSISSNDLLESGINTPTRVRMPHSEKIVPGCISRGESLEEVEIPPSIKVTHSERLVSGSISRGSSGEDIINKKCDRSDNE